MKHVTAEEIQGKLDESISVSEADKKNGSPKEGDMIARNPKNHEDQWLIAEKYHKDNFELIGQCLHNTKGEL